jgi:hypothetical protein
MDETREQGHVGRYVIYMETINDGMTGRVLRLDTQTGVTCVLLRNDRAPDKWQLIKEPAEGE